MSKVAAAVAPAVDPLKSLERKIPEIDVNLVMVQSHGHISKELFVRLPKDFVSDDLKEPSAWRAVQRSGSRGIRKFDRLFLIAYDESWFAEAVVAAADAHGVVLSRPRISTMPERFDKLFETPEYRLTWNGAGYVVERKSDGHVMTQPVANVELATRLLAQLYPQRV